MATESKLDGMTQVWNGMSKEERAAFRKAMDANGDGKLSFGEASAYAAEQEEKSAKRKAWATYAGDKAIDLIVCIASIIAAVIAGIIG